MKRNINSGFTLLELMISITLGLLITAAAIQLLFSGQISFRMQKGLSEVQDNANYGLRFITQEIRKANYGQVNSIHDRLENGGVVLTSSSFSRFPTVSGLTFTAANVPTNLPRSITSNSEEILSKTGNLSNAIVPTTDASNSSPILSDQLVVQYYADQDGIDCEGNRFNAGKFIIQRFFLRKDTNTQSDLNDALVLACEAGSYASGDTQIKRNVSGDSIFGTTSGQIIMYRVDHFHYLLGVSNQENTGQKRYMSIDTYLSLNEYPRPRINSIELGILVRSIENVGATNIIQDNQKFKILDQEVQIKKSTNVQNQKYVRQVVKQTVAFRNGLAVLDKAEGI